ncbi:MAG: phosphate signaling complex protein PhoU [Candidatus Krumholzibacteriia bacterium]
MRLTKEVDRLKKQLLSLSAVVEESVHKAVTSTSERNPALAREVIEEDARIDETEVEIEEDCLKILALHQPVAIDLRYIVVVLKINNDLERIGDLAVNIAERASHLGQHPDVEWTPQLETMGDKTRLMLRRSLDALVDADADLARNVLALDDDVDGIHREMFTTVAEQVQARPGRFLGYVQLLSVSRNLERIADLATNIAEDVIYLLEGVIVRHRHHK